MRRDDYLTFVHLAPGGDVNCPGHCYTSIDFVTVTGNQLSWSRMRILGTLSASQPLF
jgi:hypothetical protein